MQLTSRGRYAVMAMADLAKNNVKQPTNLAEISLRQGISLAYLEQLFLLTFISFTLEPLSLSNTFDQLAWRHSFISNTLDLMG